MIHLDTSFLIHSLVSGTPAGDQFEQWLLAGEELNISTIALSELLCGPLAPYDQTLINGLFPSPEPFLSADASKAAELFNVTGRRSRSLADCQIAAVALRCNAHLATANVSDFAAFRSHGLLLAGSH
jgi:predicted nucleic acid-binding protein